jgi:alkylated DNA nucleotide flippase Atl1
MKSVNDEPTREHAAILRVIRSIPPGCVASYGEIATRAGLPGRARLVGRVLGDFAAPDLPWFRVLRSDGRIAFAKGSQPFRGKSAISPRRACWWSAAVSISRSTAGIAISTPCYGHPRRPPGKRRRRRRVGPKKYVRDDDQTRRMRPASCRACRGQVRLAANGCGGVRGKAVMILRFGWRIGVAALAAFAFSIGVQAQGLSHWPDGGLRDGFEGIVNGPDSDVEAARFLTRPRSARARTTSRTFARSATKAGSTSSTRRRSPRRRSISTGSPSRSRTITSATTRASRSGRSTPPARAIRAAAVSEQCARRPLRQRVALALSEIFVVSNSNGTLAYEPWALASFYDMLAARCVREAIAGCSRM